MNTKKYRWIFYFITATIITTIAVQFYWNYKNYEKNKQQVGYEIQLSLDNAIEEYYAELAKDDFTTIINISDLKNDSTVIKSVKFDTIVKFSQGFQKFKSIIKNDKAKPKVEFTSISITSDDVLDKNKTDSILSDFKKGIKINTQRRKNNPVQIKYFKGDKTSDSLQFIENLRPIFFSIATSFIEYDELDSLINRQLTKKKLFIDYTFNHIKEDTLFYSSKKVLNSMNNRKIVESKSTYLKSNEKIQLEYTNPNLEALKRSSIGISLSLLLSILIISCLFYLLKIINQQKELATIKNDLISNITHEFKTPIATVSTAIEAIENFNVLEDKEKTKKYLSMSSIQLKKLNQMVEKLLETATLDSEQLILKKETIDVVETIEKLVTKHQFLHSKKEINFSSNLKPIYLNIDDFHFENAVSNLIDNAVKYGGNNIEITINAILNTTEISIADNGNGIEKNQQEKIFDKFYRVPKGNTHNVKGFGIGLYYSKKIIEKHKGTISLFSNKKQTIFKITIPNE